MEVDEIMHRALQIRYVKLHFTLLFPEDAHLPREKVSALRGGMGEMLLRANCIRNRQCEVCDFESECIVQRTLYSRFDVKPEFVTVGDSVGYVLECDNHQEYFQAGETLKFQMTLFGKTIVYFNQFLQALHALGMQGIGKEKEVFRIVSVRNIRNQKILDGNQVWMKNYQVDILENYVKYRMEQIAREGIENRLVFQTPASLKYQGEMLQEFAVEPIMLAIKRRIYMLDCFEGIFVDIREETKDDIVSPNYPRLLYQESHRGAVERYSNRKNSRMVLKGIKGMMQMDSIEEEYLPLFLAGEILHIGKNTSFGFGKYRLV